MGRDNQGTSSYNEAISVLGVFPHNKEKPTAVDIYRITSPHNAINQNARDMKCDWMRAQDILDDVASGVVPDRYDLLVMPRVLVYDSEVEELIKVLRVLGDTVVFETDDDYTNKYREVSEYGQTCLKIASLVDHITVSTPWLGDLLTSETGVPHTVLPNSIEFEFFSSVSEDTDRQIEGFNLMLAGTKTHYEDWKPAARAALNFMDDHEDVNLVLAGFYPDYIPDRPRVIRLRPVPYGQYPSVLRQADIVLCSVDPEDKFNWSKSPIKAIESWSSARRIRNRIGGAAVIATQSKTYNGTVQHNHNGILVGHDPKEWESAIELLYNDRALREKIQVEGYKDARKQHNMERNWIDWYRTYKKLTEEQR